MPALPNGSDQIGGTQFYTGAYCNCTCNGSSWKLVGCVGRVYIQVAIKSGLSQRRGAFARHAESQHVLDLADASGRYRQIGEFVEQQQKEKIFTSQQDCQNSSAQRIADAQKDAASDVAAESKRRWDYLALKSQLWPICGLAPSRCRIHHGMFDGGSGVSLNTIMGAPAGSSRSKVRQVPVRISSRCQPSRVADVRSGSNLVVVACDRTD